jgi:hypothetical protein
MKPYLKGICFIVAMLLSRQDWAVSHDAFDSSKTNWALSEQVGAVSVYTGTFPKSNIKAFRAQATIDLPLAQILAAMAEPGSGAKWLDGCLSAKNLGGQTLGNRITYTLNDLPWPFSNRDIVARVITTNPNGPDEIIINVTNASDIIYQESNHAVRIQSLNAVYRLRALSPTRTEFLWSQHTEPAGYLPDWLINAKLIDIPSLSIPNLVALASNERYAGAQLIFDSNMQFDDIVLASGLQMSSLFPKLTKHASHSPSTSEK